MAYLPPLNGGRLNASITGNTAGVATVLSSGTMYLSGGSNVTLSQTSNSIGFVGPTFVGSNGVTFGTNGLSVTASVNAGGGPAIIGGANTFSTGTLSFNPISPLSIVSTTGPSLNFAVPAVSYLSGSGAVSVSTNGSTIAISAPVQSAQTQLNIQALSAGTTSANTGAVYFSNSNNITFGLNGSVMTASFAGGGGAGTNTFGVTGANTSGNGNTVSGSNVQLVFAGNNVTLSQLTAANAATITISAASQTLQTSNVIQGISAAGSSVTSGNVVFSNSNNVTFGMSNQTITASFAGGGGGGVAIAGGGTTYTSGTANFTVGSGALTISSSTAAGGSQSLNFYAPNTSSLSAVGALSIVPNGSTLSISGIPFDVGVSGTNASGFNTASSFSNGLYLAGGTNITVSQTTNATGLIVSVVGPTFVNSNGVAFGTNGQSITASVTPPSIGTMSNWEPIMYQEAMFTTAAKLSNQVVYFNKIQPMGYVSASQMQQLLFLSASTTNSGTNTYGMTMQAGIYSANGATLSLINGSSGSMTYSFVLSSNAALSTITGLRGMTMPFPLSASAGNYWLGVWSRSSFSSSSVSQSLTTANVFAMNALSAANFNFNNVFGQAPNASAGVQEAVGYYTNTSVTNGSTVMPINATMASISQSSAGQPYPYVAFKNTAW